MNRMIKRYVPFMKAGIQNMIVYRLNFMGFVIGGLIYCFVMFYLWRAVFASHAGGVFLGFSMMDMVIFLFLSNTTNQLIYSEVSEVIGEEIRDGSISMRLLKPVNTDLSYMFNELGSILIKLVVLVFPMILGLEIYRFYMEGAVLFRPAEFGLYLLSAVLGYLISFRVNLCFGFMSFYMKNLWGITILKNSIVDFLSGSLIPLAFMPEALRHCLEYLPFASMGYTPVMLYMGKYGEKELLFRIGLQIVWAILMYALSKLIWFGAIKKLCVQGG